MQCSLPNTDVRFCKCDLFGQSGRPLLVAVVGLSSYSVVGQSRPLQRRHQKFRTRVISHLKRFFSPNYVPWLPTKIIFCERSPSVTSHGKLFRRSRKISRLTESYVWKKWASAAGSPKHQISFDTTFFEIGGSSLSAVHLVEFLSRHSKGCREKLLSLIFTSTFRSFIRFLLNDTEKTHSPEGFLADATPADIGVFSLSSRPMGKFTKAITGGNVFQTTLHPAKQLSIEFQWVSNLGKCVDAPALIIHPASDSLSNSVVCIGSHSGQLACLNLITGERQWCADGSVISGRIEARAAYAPSASAEFISVGTLSGKLHTFDLASGASLWGFDTGGAIKSAPIHISNCGLLVLGSHGRKIHAIDIRFPLQAVWSNAFDNSPIVSEISADDSGTYLLATSLGGTVGCVDIRRPNELLWKCCGLAPIFTKATLAYLSSNERKAVVFPVNGQIRSFDALSGQLAWQSTITAYGKQSQIFRDPLWNPRDQEFVVGTSCGFLFGIEASTGASKWILDCRSDANQNEPTQLNTPSMMYCRSSSLNLGEKRIVLSRADGKISIGSYPNQADIAFTTYAHYQLPGRSFSSPVACTESNTDAIRLVTGCRDDNVYCLTLN